MLLSMSEFFIRINHCSNATEEMVGISKLLQVISKPVDADVIQNMLYALYVFSYSKFPKTLCILIPFKDKSTACLTHFKVLKSNRRDCVVGMSNEKGSQFSICTLLTQKQLGLVSHYHQICMSNTENQKAIHCISQPVERSERDFRKGLNSTKTKDSFHGTVHIS